MASSLENDIGVNEIDFAEIEIIQVNITTDFNRIY